MFTSRIRAQLLEVYRCEVEARDAQERDEDEQRYLLRACAGTLLRIISDEQRHAEELQRYKKALELHVKLLDASKSEGPMRQAILNEFARSSLWMQYLWKREFLRAQYEEYRRSAYIRLILMPELLRDAALWYRLHLELVKRTSRTDEPSERRQLAELEASERHAAGRNAEQAVVKRHEDIARAAIEAEWVNSCAPLEERSVALRHQAISYYGDAQIERIILDVDGAFATVAAEEADERRAALTDMWVQCALYQRAAICEEMLRDAFQSFQAGSVEWQLARVQLDESERRLFILVGESNAFNGAKDQLELRRQTEAVLKIQSLSRRMLARARTAALRGMCGRCCTERIAEEHDEYNTSRRAEMRASYRSVEPFLSAALSYRVTNDKLRGLARAIIGPVAEGYLDRKLLNIERHIRHQDRLAALAEALVHAAPLLQRVGRGFLVREEVFDVLVEEWEIQESERQQRVTAGLVIWWAWREFRDARKLRVERQLREKRLWAIVKIQSLFRAAHCRDYYKLVMLPRHWVATAKKIQKACRGFQARRGVRKMKSLLILHAASRSYLSRWETERRRLFPFARRIQCFWRVFLARQVRSRRQVALNLRSRTAFQDCLVTPIQAAFRGYLQRKHAKVQLAISRALRKEKIESLATQLDDDLWRIGRGFLARRRVHAMSCRRLSMALITQRFARGTASLLVLGTLQAKWVERLRQQVFERNLTVVQSFLHGVASINLLHVRQAERAKYVLCAEALHSALAPVVSGYVARKSMARLWTAVFKAATKIQRLARRSAAIRTRSSLQLAKVASMDEENRQGAAAVLTLHWRRLQEKKNIAAAMIQRCYQYRRLRLARNREVLDAQTAERLLNLRSVVRSELVFRRAVEQEEMASASRLKRVIREGLCFLSHLNTNVVLPPSFVLLEEHKRLQVVEAYLDDFGALADAELIARRNAFLLSTQNRFSTGCTRLCRSENVLRERIAKDELNTRRLLAVSSFNRIKSVFLGFREQIVADESKVRERLMLLYDEELQVYAKRFTLWLISTVKSPADEHHTLAKADSAVRVTNEKRSQGLRGPLRPFQIPVDLLDAKDCSPAEFDDIFAAALRHNRSATLSAPAAVGRSNILPRLVAESTRSAETTETILSSRAAIPPRSTLSQEEQAALSQHDQFMVTRAVRKMLAVSNDGVLDAQPLLQTSMTGDEVAAPLVEFVADPLHPVKHLRLSGLALSDKAFLRVLRFAVTHHRPLESVDLSHNMHITDITASHLAVVIDAIPSLAQIDVTATNVSVPKRQLLAHILQRKLSQNQANATDKGDLNPPTLRRPRPLQIPRRNGWTTTYKVHRLAPLPQPRQDGKDDIAEA